MNDKLCKLCNSSLKGHNKRSIFCDNKCRNKFYYRQKHQNSRTYKIKTIDDDWEKRYIKGLNNKNKN